MAQLIVTTALDENDVGATSINPGGTGLSLREALAIVSFQPKTITFDPSVFSGGTQSLIRLQHGELVVSAPTTIDATGATDVVITGDSNADDALVAGSFVTDVAASYGGVIGAPDDLLDDNSRIFNVTSGTGTTTLAGLTLTGGATSGFEDGGAAVRVSDVIQNFSPSALELTQMVIAGNSTRGSTSNGAGVYSEFTPVEITASTISGNVTYGGFSGGAGLFGLRNTIDVSKSTFSNNTATQWSFLNADVDIPNGIIFASAGGGIASIVAQVTISQTTIVDNEGGGIYSLLSDYTLIHSTVTANQLAGVYAGPSGLGNSQLTLQNSIVLGNTIGDLRSVNSGPTDDYTGGGNDLFDLGGNILTGDTTQIFDQTRFVGFVFDIPPLFDPVPIFGGLLADNGGPVQTVLLKRDASNPALDIGTVPSGLLFDPAGGNRNIDLVGVFNGGTADAGALELQSLTPGGGTGLFIDGTSADEIIAGNVGNDRLRGFGGNDTVLGNEGHDTVNGGAGNDRLEGGAGDDTLYGQGENDTMNGGLGNDLVIGNDGNDFMVGDLGNDTLQGRAGIDTLIGGDGDDMAFGGDDGDRLEGGNGNDTLQGNGGGDIVFGGAGNDEIFGQLGNDTVFAEGGQDSLFGGAGDDTLWGGNDDDEIFGGSGSDSLNGEEGNDLLRGNQQNDTVRGEGGADTLFGDDGADFMLGGADNDSLLGGNGADTLWGGSGVDTLAGGAGNDTLRGNASGDTLRGNAGADVFEFNQTLESFGTDVDLIDGIEGIGAFGGDRIDVSGIDANELTFGDDAFVFLGAVSSFVGITFGPGALWVENVGTQTRLYGSVNNDSTIDFEVHINDFATFTASDYTAADFVL